MLGYCHAKKKPSVEEKNIATNIMPGLCAHGFFEVLSDQNLFRHKILLLCTY